MKLTVNIPELKIEDELLFVNSMNDKKIEISSLTSDEFGIYQKFINLTNNSNLFEVINYDNEEEEVYIHRYCTNNATEQKYIDYKTISESDKNTINDFVKMVKNK